ncbi:MAG: hypothetical protein WDO56_05880 [Gammaproteobacteria bacterium]
MIRLISLPMHAGQALFNALRWLACEFFWVPMRANCVSASIGVSRSIGLAVVVGLLHFQLRDGLATPVWAGVMQVALACLISILLGNLAKETLLDVSGRLVNSFGIDFTRRGFLLDGSAFSETLRTDGTWYRSISNATGTICEWTDTFGKCTRIVTPPRAQRERTTAR